MRSVGLSAAHMIALQGLQARLYAMAIVLVRAGTDHSARRGRYCRRGGGLIVAPHAVTLGSRDLIARLAAQYRLPAVYSDRYFAESGGLLSFGNNTADLFRRSATYIDRILKGAKPADLPVQLPTKFELIINLKTAKTLGLTVPPTLVGRADEVIE